MHSTMFVHVNQQVRFYRFTTNYHRIISPPPSRNSTERFESTKGHCWNSKSPGADWDTRFNYTALGV